MRGVVASGIITAKFNRFHLLVFLMFICHRLRRYDLAKYGVGLPWMLEDWDLTSSQAGGQVGSHSLFGGMVMSTGMNPKLVLLHLPCQVSLHRSIIFWSKKNMDLLTG
ncbi:hypothetical protein IOC57_06060 [Bacillus sp. SD075]|uniref:hypothetical protein n=1 Tax=Bacillus sp. SD075 TaxID=2781732 RepID=UPI001A958624|nr:hypothetical protein [Bacillus sp. SD075]MBO0997320.1 hypothetical protein [Bacillus sp. SD075]